MPCASDCTRDENLIFSLGGFRSAGKRRMIREEKKKKKKQALISSLLFTQSFYGIKLFTVVIHLQDPLPTFL